MRDRSAMVLTAGDHLAIWQRLTTELGLAGANVGEERAAPGPDSLAGVVERVVQDERRLRSAQRDDHAR